MRNLSILLLLAPVNVYSQPQFTISLQNEYNILGVKDSDSLAVIKKAHRALSLENHPDKKPNCSECKVRLVEINSAYDKIIYTRKQSDSPGLEMFFGFSEKLFNLIHEVFELWEHIPIVDKQRCANLFESYRSSESLDMDLKHLGVLFQSWLESVLASNAFELTIAFGLILSYNMFAFIGFCWFLGWVFTLFYRLVKLPFTIVWFIASALLSFVRHPANTGESISIDESSAKGGSGVGNSNLTGTLASPKREKRE